MVYVVAEIGVNWDGDFKLAKEMMENAKKCGCDAVKFQSYNPDSVKEHPKYLKLRKTTISEENIGEIDQFARETDIEWFATPMYLDAVDLLEPYVKKFKIRVADGRKLFQNNESELLDKVLNTNKDVIISVEKSPKSLSLFNNPKISWLYCVSKYPCSFSDLDFSEIRDFNGYSNHCPNILAPLIAVIHGAKIIEVHITSDKTKDFVDNPVSFDYNELNNLLKFIRESEKIKR